MVSNTTRAKRHENDDSAREADERFQTNEVRTRIIQQRQTQLLTFWLRSAVHVFMCMRCTVLHTFHIHIRL